MNATADGTAVLARETAPAPSAQREKPPAGGGFGRWWSRMRRGRGPIYLAAFLVTVALVLLRYVDPVPLQVARLKSFDLYQRLAPRAYDPRLPVAIIDLDENSLAAYGQWPWPRNLVAELVARLMNMGVAVVGFDIVFAEPDRMSPEKISESLHGLDDETRKRLLELPGNDAAFANVLRQSRAVLGQSTNTVTVADPNRPVPRKARIAEKTHPGGNPRQSLLIFPGMTRNLAVLEDAAAGIGMFTLKPEVDGVVRRVPMLMMVEGEIYPSLTVEMLRVATGQSAIAVESDRAGIVGIIMRGIGKIPTDGIGRTWVHYSPHKRERYISAKDVLDGTVAPERLAGRLVLLGTSAVGLLDIKSTPIDDAMPGVEVHAQLLETILSKSYLIRPNIAPVVEMTALIVVCLLMTALLTRVGAAWTLFVGGGVIVALMGASWYLYVDKGILFSVTYIGAAGFVLYSVLTYLSYVREESERRQVRDAFSRYMSPALVEQLAANPARLTLGGEMREMTLLFCDIRGFTGISEIYKDDPQGLTRLINRFLTPMTDLILERRGTIDKYMGDCIMAFWNAPLDDDQHAAHACDAALAMTEGVRRLNDSLRAEAEAAGRPFVPINIGIGLNSGVCCVGNMGSEQRFDYSVLGDDVNLASRLEGQSKTYGVGIVIGQNTQARVPEFATLELDLIKVKGKDEAVHIFALLGDHTLKESENFQRLAERHAAMLEAYRSQRWADARALLAECRALEPTLEALYELYESRIAAYEENPPPADWDGVYVATSK